MGSEAASIDGPPSPAGLHAQVYGGALRRASIHAATPDSVELIMREAGEKSNILESKKLVFARRKTGPNRKISSKLKIGTKASHRRKEVSKCKPPSEMACSALLERTSSDFVSRKHGKRTLLKTLSRKSTGSHSPFICLKGNSLLNSMQMAVESNTGCNSKKLRKRRRPKRERNQVELDEASRLKRKARYLLVKMKLEQNLIDAYIGEGWKGQSREKIKPEKELQRAKKQILNCKLGIRDAVRQLDCLSSRGGIEASLMSPDGSVHHEHIFCAKCNLREAFPDNDIILCDGTCNCAFHQKCLEPPLATENIPQGDQRWLCNFCECKEDILEATNAHLGTHFAVNSTWQEIFMEEAALPAGGKAIPNPEDDWPTDDSEDDDYDPASNGNSSSFSAAATENDASDDLSGFSSLSWSLEDETFCGESDILAKKTKGSDNNIDLIPNVESDGFADHDIIAGRRRRRAVDYRKLYDEMFGKADVAIEQISEDEDWGPAKKKRIRRESDAACTLITLFEGENKSQSGETDEQMEIPVASQLKRRIFRIPPSAVEKLRCVFAENELPCRAVKEKLSRQLNLEPEKVNKWFKNARYLALKSRKGLRSKEDGTDLVARYDGTSAFSNMLRDAKKNQQGGELRSVKSFAMKQHKRASFGFPTTCQEGIMEFSEDMSLKKQLKYLKEKMNREKRSISLKSSVIAEKEMQRLYHAKTRLEQMKKALCSLQKEKVKLHEQSIILVPVAEVREKR